MSVDAIATGLPLTIWYTAASAPVTCLTWSTTELSPLTIASPKASLPWRVTLISPPPTANPRITSAAVATRARISVSTVCATSRRTTYSRTAANAKNTAAVTTRICAARERRHQSKAPIGFLSRLHPQASSAGRSLA